MSDKIKLARYRNTSYFVKYDADGSNRQFTWSGSKDGRAEIKQVPREVVDWLTMHSICFDRGELVIVEDNEETQEIKEGILEKESYDNNTHTQEEIEKLLKGNIMKMKAELKKITVDSEKQFVVEVASKFVDELPTGKVNFIAEWMGVNKDVLFD